MCHRLQEITELRPVSRCEAVVGLYVQYPPRLKNKPCEKLRENLKIDERTIARNLHDYMHCPLLLGDEIEHEKVFVEVTLTQRREEHS